MAQRGVAGPAGRRRAAMALGLLLLGLAAAYVVSHWGEVVRGLEPHPAWLAVAVACELLLVGLRAVLLREACRPFGVEVGAREAIGLVSWATLANYVATSLGGTGVRAAYLKKRHGLDLGGFVSLTSALYALQFLLLALAGLGATWRVDELPPAAALALRVFFASLAAVCILLWAVPFPSPRGEGVVARTVRRVVGGWRLLSGRSLGRLLPLLLLYVGAGAVTIFAYFAFAGRRFEPSEALLVSSVSELSMLVAVTPAGLGVLESAVGLGARLVGAPLALGLTVAGIRRLAGTLVAVLLAVQYPLWRTLPGEDPSRS